MDIRHSGYDQSNFKMDILAMDNEYSDFELDIHAQRIYPLIYPWIEIMFQVELESPPGTNV